MISRTPRRAHGGAPVPLEVPSGSKDAPRKGRPPPAPTSSSLGSDARALLARLMSEAPPGAAGFGGKVSSDQFVSIWPSASIPRELAQNSAVETEKLSIKMMVNQGEKESLACLKGILTKTTKTLSAVENKLSDDARSHYSAHSSRHSDVSAATVRTGVSRKKALKMHRNRVTGSQAGSDIGNLGDLDAVFEEGSNASFLSSSELRSDDGAEEEVSDYSYGHLVPPVQQGALHDSEEERAVAADRMLRLLRDEPELSDHQYPSLAEVVALMRRVRFFRDSELQDDIFPVVADWFEVQCYEPLRMVTEEGTWCHSFFLLYSGTVEAREHGTRSAVAGSGADAGLAPTVLHPGAHWGEAAFATSGQSLAHVCSVRTLTRCTLLVLRRRKIDQELASLPLTARQAWAQETERHQALFSNLAARWRMRSLRHVKFFSSSSRLPAKFPLATLQAIDSFATYQLLPAGSTLLRQGERAPAVYILLRGEVGVLHYDEASLYTAPRTARDDEKPVKLLRRITEGSDLPLIGLEALSKDAAAHGAALPAALSANGYVTRTACQIFALPVGALHSRPQVLNELRARVSSVLSQPQGLMARLQPPMPRRGSTIATSIAAGQTL